MSNKSLNDFLEELKKMSSVNEEKEDLTFEDKIKFESLEQEYVTHSSPKRKNFDFWNKVELKNTDRLSSITLNRRNKYLQYLDRIIFAIEYEFVNKKLDFCIRDLVVHKPYSLCDVCVDFDIESNGFLGYYEIIAKEKDGFNAHMLRIDEKMMKNVIESLQHETYSDIVKEIVDSF